MCIRSPNPGALPAVKMTRAAFSLSASRLCTALHTACWVSHRGNLVSLADFANRVRKGLIVSDMLASWGDVSRPRCVNSAIYSQL